MKIANCVGVEVICRAVLVSPVSLKEIEIRKSWKYVNCIGVDGICRVGLALHHW